jgi:methylmalonyl-CoA mutase N-terminal domain/subunit
MREKYGAKNPRSLLMRFHAQTSGASLTWQQPYNNIIRTTVEALAAILGGAQSLHTNSFDEAWALPTERAVQIALRTQQVIAEETGVGSVADPLGGSYYVEWLTERLEEEAYRYFDRLDSAGGVLNAIKSGFIQREIAENAYRLSQRVEKEQDVIIGVNKYNLREEPPIQTLKIDFRAQKKQIARLKKVKRERDERKVTRLLEKLQKAYESEEENSMYPMMEAVMAYATLGEVVETGKRIWGLWKEPVIV